MNSVGVALENRGDPGPEFGPLLFCAMRAIMVRVEPANVARTSGLTGG
jgi:hypothetical protein